MSRVIGKATLNRRRDLRRERQFPAQLEDYEVGVLDISLGGAHLYAPDAVFGAERDGLAPEQSLRLALPDEAGHAVTYNVEVVRTEPEDKGLSVQFAGLTDRQFRLLERIITHGLPQYKDYQIGAGDESESGATDSDSADGSAE